MANASTPYFSTKKPRMYGIANASKHETVYKNTNFQTVKNIKKRRKQGEKTKEKIY
ncbi:hypothetical protein [Ruminobacter sp.]|uniref:hypothetical protein n=1 Tax=Ruminobacter sp. TaxID=2774296 RepID=UPI00386393F0